MQRPNILVILVDDIGMGDFGFTGAKDIPTPNIDRLAKSGAVCTSGYVTPMCAPTRAAFLTGRYPQRFGLEDNRPCDGMKNGLPREVTLLPQRLREAGYTTHLVGKWHLGKGDNSEFAPRNRGFDTFFGYFGAFGQYVNPTYSRDGKESVVTGYGTDLLTDEACKIIEARHDKPYFLHLAYTAAHLKQEAKPEDLAKFTHLEPKRQMAAAIIHNLDTNIGKLMTKLDPNTLVFFLSDNGGEPRVLGTLNGPLRGQKFDVYEGGVRVPFVVRWPGQIKPGTRLDTPVSAIDIQPTVLAAAGIPQPPDQDGLNLLPALTRKGKLPERPHFWHTTDHATWQQARRSPNLSAVRLGDWKLVIKEEGAVTELYNLKQDLSEKQDQAAKEPPRVAELRQLFDAWNAKNQPQTFPPKQVRK
ncbi:sulfatase-like hydrolase/transferase [Armatimonas sp.]|uniref:sulfatase-like hydrolase/transferase n=1 Tax=Armatimonas sp. TaxID=1872638 RepID=UPI00286CBC79|nr:sulfatase-like hydrolase/transferase [Armatimonas sp.]